MTTWSPAEVAQIRQHLSSLSEHPLFTQAERLTKFLNYIVEATLMGDVSKLNQNAIAIDVFDRGADFDPSADSIVRVEAGRLRAKLREYYETVGREDGIRIELPKGSYAPVFHMEASVTASEPDTVSQQIAPVSTTQLPLRIVIPAIGLIVVIVLVYLALGLSDQPQPEITSAIINTTVGDDTDPVPVSVVLNKTPSIAVLPFVNMSEDKEKEYFSDGIAEEILNALAQLPQLRVAGRTSSFYFKGKDVDLATIAEKLRVSHALEGSVRWSGERLRITAKLLNTNNGFQIWSESYDRKLEDVFAIQEDIARAIVNALRLELGDNSHRRLVNIGTTNLQAYNLLLRAKSASDSGSADGDLRAIALLEDAIELDPEFAEAYGYLAYAHSLRHSYVPYRDLAPVIKGAYENALKRNSELGSALCVKAYDEIFSDWDWVTAGKLFEKVLKAGAIDGPCIDIYPFWYSYALGRPEEGLEMLSKVGELDPLNFSVLWNLGALHIMAGNYEEGYKLSLATLQVEPRQVYILYFAASAALYTSRLIEAEHIIEKLEALDEPAAQQFAISKRIHLEVIRSNFDSARRTFNNALGNAKSGSNPSPGLWFHLAISAVLLGELDKALELFEQAYEAGAAGVVLAREEISNFPVYSVNGQRMLARPDFQAFLAKMNLDDASIEKLKTTK